MEIQRRFMHSMMINRVLWLGIARSISSAFSLANPHENDSISVQFVSWMAGLFWLEEIGISAGLAFFGMGMVTPERG